MALSSARGDGLLTLSARIAALALSDAQRRCFADELRLVAAADGPPNAEELGLIERLLPPGGAPAAGESEVEPAGLQSLWRHAELLVIACIYVAVSDGEYTVDEARAVSVLAHQLGLSSRRLRQVEERTFAELARRAG